MSNDVNDVTYMVDRVGNRINIGDDVVYMGTSHGYSKMRVGKLKRLYQTRILKWETVAGESKSVLTTVYLPICTFEGKRFLFDPVANKGKYVTATQTSVLRSCQNIFKLEKPIETYL